MKTSNRSQSISSSLTLSLNTRSLELIKQGHTIYNLTAGQLPFPPPKEFISLIKSECDAPESYRYSPVSGFPELRALLLDHFSHSREVSPVNFDCIISNGAKHTLSNIMGAIIDPGDEVVLLRPYWVSYPEIVSFFGGLPKMVDSNIKYNFTPSLNDIEKTFTKKTKAIIVNSPNNPAGIHYNKEWMEQFGRLLLKYPHIWIISDEIYDTLYYAGQAPTYFYQYIPELLPQTCIINGISKSLASTGLRLGYLFAQKDIIKVLEKIQGHTASNANSLIQRALMPFNMGLQENYLDPIKKHLRENVQELTGKLKTLSKAPQMYNPQSAFYYLLHFTEDKKDRSIEWTESLLEQYGVVCIPGTAFGMANTARVGLVSKKEEFRQAFQHIISFMKEWK